MEVEWMVERAGAWECHKDVADSREVEVEEQWVQKMK